MARGITVTGTTGSVTATGGTLGVHISSVPNFLDILKLKIQPSGGAGPFDVELFQKDTLGSSDLAAKWQDSGGNIYDPMDISSGTPAEGKPSEAIVAYEDADATGELHLKFTNNDSSNRTYDYSITYEERWSFDSSNVASAQAVELLGDTLYLGGRTGSEASIRRSGVTVRMRLGDDSGFAALECGALNAQGVLAEGNTIYIGGQTSSEVLLTRAGSELWVRKGDNSGFASISCSGLSITQSENWNLAGGFTGSGAYNNFTFVSGICTSAS